MLTRIKPGGNEWESHREKILEGVSRDTREVIGGLLDSFFIQAKARGASNDDAIKYVGEQLIAFTRDLRASVADPAVQPEGDKTP